jgi:hypothetical protein
MNDVGFGEAGLGVENLFEVGDAERLPTDFDGVRRTHGNAQLPRPVRRERAGVRVLVIREVVTKSAEPSP